MCQVQNEQLYICFNCNGEADLYHEFEDMQGIENPECTMCGDTHYTLPKYYLEDMSIPQLQKLLSEMAEETPWIPLLDLKVKDFRFPDSIGCDHNLSSNS